MAAQRHCILALAFGLGLMVSGASAVHADELDDIVKAGSLKVGIFEDFPPFSSAGTDMSLHGYDIDVANALAAAMKVKLDLVGITGQNRIPYLNEHKVNILLSVGESAERAKVLDFTDAYAPYYIAVLGGPSVAVKGAADLAGKNPSKQNRSVGNAAIDSAATAAQGPGIAMISMPAAAHSRTRSKPGSLMPGVPASLTNATVTPRCIRETNSGDRLSSL